MKKILVVDDQMEVRELVEVTLSIGDYEITQVESGEKAIETARDIIPDLIIMDIMMPGGIDGLEATRRIREIPELKNSRIIMLTAKGQKSDIQAGLDAGAEDYFIKPFSPLDLINKVESILGS